MKSSLTSPLLRSLLLGAGVAAGFAAVIVDGTRSIAGHELSLTPLAELMGEIARAVVAQLGVTAPA